MRVIDAVAAAAPTDRVPVIAHVLGHHADEAAGLATSRRRLVAAPHVGLSQLRRTDDRLAAHLDGLAVAGEDGWRACETTLAERTAGAVFAAAAVAVEFRRTRELERLYGLAQESPEIVAELLAAFEWVERRFLQGTVAELLRSADPVHRLAGIAACGAHGVDPGLAGGPWLQDADSRVRARALRAAGEVGAANALPACRRALDDADAGCRFQAARSAMLLGDRGAAMEVMAATGVAEGPQRAPAFVLTVQAAAPGAAHAILQRLAADPASMRWLLQGSGIAGDPQYIPWLIRQMGNPETARLAGEAFVRITGADFDALQLTRPRPEDAKSGPTEEPEDEAVEMDPDEDLPWPDPDGVGRWWAANGDRFEPGTRHFMGAPATPAQCLHVLKTGRQSERALAATGLCLLAPGTPLFNTSAPAWRQQTMLAQME